MAATWIRTVCMLVPVAALLAGCRLDELDKVDENAPPSAADFKKEVIEAITKSLDDATNLRNAGISTPTMRPVEGIPRYVACVRFNQRNMNHEYTGITERIAYFYGGHINQFVTATPGQCSFAVYQPFPELEKICQGTKCD